MEKNRKKNKGGEEPSEEARPLDASKKEKSPMGCIHISNGEKIVNGESLFKKLAAAPMGQENLSSDSLSVLNISEGERTMEEDNTGVKKPVRSTERKKMVRARRDITDDDMKDYRVSPYMTKFDRLVQVGERAWEIAEEEDHKLMIISSPRKEEFCSSSPTAKSKKKMMRQNNSLVINDSVDHERMMKENIVKKPVAKYLEDMSREDKLKRERLLKKSVVEEISKKSSVNKRIRYESEDIEEEDGKAIKKTTTKGCKEGVHKSLDYIPDMPDEVNDWIQRINGFKVKLVIQKQLYTTDLSRSQNRISMPFNQLHQSDFLIEIEEELLKKNTPDMKNRMGIDVLFIEPNGEQNFNLLLKRWDMPKEDGHNMRSMYVFNGKWHDLCKKYKMAKGTVVQIWSFRYDGGKLGFAMVIVDRGPNGSATSKGGDGNGNGNGNGNGTYESRSNDYPGKSGSSFNTNNND